MIFLNGDSQNSRRVPEKLADAILISDRTDSNLLEEAVARRDQLFLEVEQEVLEFLLVIEDVFVS